MRLTFRPDALADLEEIHDYIAEDDAATADSFLGQLRRRCDLLAEQPMIGRERPELYPGLRSFAFGRYVILYRVLADEVEIAAVIHGARDIERLF
jgi:plasmid stabilization system protein ParE